MFMIYKFVNFSLNSAMLSTYVNIKSEFKPFNQLVRVVFPLIVESGSTVSLAVFIHLVQVPCPPIPYCLGLKLYSHVTCIVLFFLSFLLASVLQLCYVA